MHFLRSAILAIPFIALLGCGGGGGGIQARVTEYGLYARGVEIVRPNPDSPSGQSRSSVGYKLVTQTQTVPLVLGISFGFCFEITGASAVPVVQVQVTHPEIVRTDGVRRSSYEVQPSLYTYAGTYWSCLGYGFDHPYELVPGTWRFTVVVNDALQASQEFRAQ